MEKHLKNCCFLFFLCFTIKASPHCSLNAAYRGMNGKESMEDLRCFSSLRPWEIRKSQCWLHSHNLDHHKMQSCLIAQCDVCNTSFLHWPTYENSYFFCRRHWYSVGSMLKQGNKKHHKKEIITFIKHLIGSRYNAYCFIHLSCNHQKPTKTKQQRNKVNWANVT